MRTPQGRRISGMVWSGLGSSYLFFSWLCSPWCVSFIAFHENKMAATILGFISVYHTVESKKDQRNPDSPQKSWEAFWLEWLSQSKPIPLASGEEHSEELSPEPSGDSMEIETIGKSEGRPRSQRDNQRVSNIAHSLATWSPFMSFF